MATPDESSPFQCSICFKSKEGRQPRGLPCYHSFCQQCLTEWHDKRHRGGHCARTKVECPTCRTISALPSGDVSSLPIDINVQQFSDFINKYSTRVSCQVCKSKERNSLCLMCTVILCETCGKKHKQLPLFSSHVLSRNICELHGASLQGVCTTCLCGVCVHCFNEGLHKDHSVDDMSSGIEKIKGNVAKCSRELKELLRIGNLEVAAKQSYLDQVQNVDHIKRSLDLIKKEIERLEKEITENEQLCKANSDSLFKEYKVHSDQASAAIISGNQLLEEGEERILDTLKSVDVPTEEMCCLLRNSLSSIPDFSVVSSSNCNLENVEDALKALQKCKLVYGMPYVTTIPFTPAAPVEIRKIKCGDGCDIVKPWRLCGTPEGDVIVCDIDGGPVYKVYKDGTKRRLHDDGIAACIQGRCVYILSTDGSTVTQIKPDGSIDKYNLNPPMSKPNGIVVSDGYVFTLFCNYIGKQSLLDSDCNETFKIAGCFGLSHMLKISHGGITKLIITDWVADQVVICDEACVELTRFGGSDSQNQLLKGPMGIGRMSNGNLLVSEWYNHRIVEFDMDGTFVRKLLTERDGIKYPADIVYKYPYLWVVENEDNGPHNLKLLKFGG